MHLKELSFDIHILENGNLSVKEAWTLDDSKPKIKSVLPQVIFSEDEIISNLKVYTESSGSLKEIYHSNPIIMEVYKEDSGEKEKVESDDNSVTVSGDVSKASQNSEVNTSGESSGDKETIITKETITLPSEEVLSDISVQIPEEEESEMMSILNTYEKLVLTYEIKDVALLYEDCAEIDLTVGTENVSARTMTGTIYFPKTISGNNKVYAWKYLNKVGEEITIGNVQEFSFSERNVTNIFFKVLVPSQFFSEVANVRDGIVMESLATTENTTMKSTNRKIAIMNFVVNTLEFVILVYVGYKTLKNIKESGKVLSTESSGEKLKYYSGLPFDDITPGQAVFLKDSFIWNKGDIFGATLLNMKIRGIVEFGYVGNEKIFQNAVMRFANDEILLKVEEKPIYNFLMEFMRKFPREDKNISLYWLQKYVQSNPKKVKQLKKEMEEIIRKSTSTLNTEAETKVKKKWKEMGLYVLLWLVVAVFYPRPFNIFTMHTWIYILSVVNIIHCISIILKTSIFTKEGEEHKAKLKGLERYMKNFDSIRGAGVPEASIWDYYMIFAMAFGIAPLILKKLKRIYYDVTTTSFLEMKELSEHLLKCEFKKNFLIER